MRKLTVLLLSVFVYFCESAHETIVYPRITTGRSGEKRLDFRAYQEDYNLKLIPSDIIGEKFILINSNNGRNDYSEPDVKDLRRKLFRSSITDSSLYIDEDGPLFIKGIINRDLRIEPYDESRHDYIQRTDIDAENAPHVISKVTPREHYHRGIYDEVIPDGIKGIPNKTDDEDGQRQSSVMTVEVCIVTDICHTKKFSSEQAAIIYNLVQYNGVQNRYDTMAQPVKIKIVCLQRNFHTTDQPYIQNNLYHGHALSSETLTDFCKYISRNFKINADIVKLTMCLPLGDQHGSSVEAGVIGIAYVGGCCDNAYKCGLSEDNGETFDGTDTSAHEIGHLLGCPHDGEGPVSYLPGSPGAKNCPWDDGFIMSYVDKNEDKFRFSSCSQACIKHLGTFSESRCLYRTDVWSSIASDNRQPGQYLMDHYLVNGDTYDTYYTKRCEKIKPGTYILDAPINSCKFSCRTKSDRSGRYTYWTFDCVDGDPCGSGKNCKNGYCI